MALENYKKTESPFEKQFANPEILGGGEGSVEIINLKPEYLKSSVPLLIVPGWVATAEVHKRNAELFAESGRHVIAMSSPHGVNVAHGITGEIPRVELHKADAVMRVLNAQGIEKVDVVAHSEAAIFVTAAARAHPERFRSITYIAPVGLMEHDSMWQLALRFGKDIIEQWTGRNDEEGRKERIWTAFHEGAKSFATGPITTIKEVKAIAGAHVQKDIRALHEAGIKIFVVRPNDDRAFLASAIEPDSIDEILNMNDTDGSIATTHNAWYLSPEKYTAAVGALLDTLDQNNPK